MPVNRNIVFIFLLLFSFAKAQNLLPYDWKIAVAPKKATETGSIPQKDWNNVSLLLSWERQGYFGRDGHCLLKTDFKAPAKSTVKNWVLSVALQCQVEDIYINGKRIGGNIPNYFWSERGKVTEIILPKGVLLPGKTNSIVIAVNDLSYTGGHSHNRVLLMPQGAKYEAGFSLRTDDIDHILDPIGASSVYIAAGAKSGTIAVKITDDFHHVVLQDTISLDKDEINLIGIMPPTLKPGFYECTAVMHDGKGYSAQVIQFGIAPEKIPVNNDTIKGHSTYWKTAKAGLQSIAPNFRVHKVDSLCSPYRDGYIAEMQSAGNLTIRGYYFVPKAAGKYPAILHVPGYGYGFQNLKPFLESKENVIELALCVRGHGISADVFNPGFDIPGIWGYNLCSETDNAYRAIYMDCVRAVDFLISRPEADTSRIGVEGGSQGGGLALATAGLCGAKISALAYFDPFPANIRDHKQIRTLMDKELIAYLKYYNNACAMEQVLHVQDLLDSAGFAHYIKCPVLFASALYDDDCPPHVGFTAYNRMKTDKRYVVYPDDSHLSESNYQTAFMAFFKEKLKF
ncbi:acetylxylan esterase [Flavobacterium sp. RHBU_3]|uniref:acetylxylan esterase n=1 Tax=Flavobacterium sp. RHBU_3 TaxID=3391184 RepID=UPI003984B208